MPTAPSTYGPAYLRAFFDAARGPVFGGSLTQQQLEGTERLLKVWYQHYADDPRFRLEELAYNLATAYHETAHTMQPVMEKGPRRYFDKYEPGTRLGRVLGNTEPGDGYRFRGAGDVQNTGRRNARHASKRLNATFGIGIDLVAQPDLRLDPFVSAHSLFLGNHEGWWTGQKLTRFINAEVTDYVNARRVVNGLDKAVTIAGYAEHFEEALRAAEAAKAREAKKPPAFITEPVATLPPIPLCPKREPKSDFAFFDRIRKQLRGMFG